MTTRSRRKSPISSSRSTHPSSGSALSRRLGGLLAALYLITIHLPGVMVLAAPQMFSRPGAGVSNIPLGVTALASPQFGDIADAVNVATGNVYYDLGSLNRNNLIKTGDDTVSATGNTRVSGLMRLMGYSKTLTLAGLPQEWSLALGDGSYSYFKRVTVTPPGPEISAAPTWVKERYASVTANAVFYISKPQEGLQTDEQWLVLYRMPGNGQMIAHQYGRDGTRTTFYNDGEYADYVQNLSQQYRTSKISGDPEGTAGTLKTEFSYTAPGNGHLSKVRDEWGRLTTYKWNDTLNRLIAVNMLVQDESNPTSWKRRIEYGYEQRGTQYYVTRIAHRTFDAQGQALGRLFELSYLEQGGQVLLQKIGRPRAMDQTITTPPLKYQVTQTVSGGGTLSPATVRNVDEGQTAIFAVTADATSRVTSVTGCDGTLSLNADGFINTFGTTPPDAYYTTGKINTNCTIQATFQPIPAGSTFQVTPTLSAGGSIFPATAQTVGLNQSISFKVTPASGYVVRNTSGCNGSFYEPKGTYTTGLIKADCNVTIEFTPGQICKPGQICGDPPPPPDWMRQRIEGQPMQADHLSNPSKPVPQGLVAPFYLPLPMLLVSASTAPSSGSMVYTTYSYSPENRVTKVETPGEMTLNYTYGSSSYGGLLVTQTQGLKTLTYEYTSGGALRKQTELNTSPDVGSLNQARILTTLYDYDGGGRMTDLRLPSGAQVQTVYDTHGNKKQESLYKVAQPYSATPPSGYVRTTRFEYDRDNQLSNTVQDVTDGQTTPAKHDLDATQTATFAYAEVSQPQTRRYWSTSVGNQAFQSLSGQDDRTKVSTSETSKSTLNYDESGRVTQLRSEATGVPEVRLTTYNYPASQARGRNLQPLTDGEPALNTPNNVLQYGDQMSSSLEKQEGQADSTGRLTTQVYDEYGNVTWTSRENNHVGLWTGSTSGLRQYDTFRAYNGFGQQTWQYEQTSAGGQDARGEGKQLWTYYTSGELKASWQGNPANVTAYSYDANGFMTEIKKGVGSGTMVSIPRSKTLLTYDTYGRVNASTTNGALTTFKYDSLDRPALTVQPDGSTLTQLYQSLTSELSSESLSRSGESTITTRHTLDALGREIRTESVGGATLDTLYDPFDRPIRITNQGLTMNANAKDRATFLVYSDLGQLVKKLDPALVTNSVAYNDAQRPYTEYTYDNRGRQTREIKLLSGGTVTPEGMTLPGGGVTATTTTQYDVYDRPIRVTDPLLYWTTTEYDRADHPVAVTRQAWGDPEKVYEDVAPGAPTTVTRLAYNAAGQPVQVIDPKNNTSRTDYDVMGNVTLQSDGRGIVVKAFGYTPDSLLEKVWEPGKSSNSSYQYGTVTATNVASNYTLMEFNSYPTTADMGTGDGRKPTTTYRAYMDTQAGSNTGAKTTYTYDYAGRVKTSILPPDQQVLTPKLEQDYDAQGHVIRQKDANGFETVSTYNAQGLLASVVNKVRSGNATDSKSFPNLTGGGLTSTYQYDASGNLTLKNERNLITEYRYNSLGKVIHESRPRVGVGTATRWKLTTYRLDGLPVSRTSYTYSTGLQGTPSGTSTVIASGNLTTTTYNQRGDVVAEESRASSGVESAMTQQVNGAGQRYRRTFIGNMGIYAMQKTTEVTPLNHANSLSYWQFDVNGNLTAKWDTPMSGTTKLALNASDKQNSFTYDYDAANNEKRQTRTVLIRQLSEPSTSNRLYQSDGGAQGVTLAASNSTTDTTYTVRGQIEKSTTTDTTPYAYAPPQQPPVAARQDAIAPLPARYQRYAYFPDGRLQTSWTGSGTTDLASKTVELYDQRGRELSVRDSNGGRIDTTAGTVQTQYGAEGVVTNTTVQGSTTSTETLTTTVGGLTGSVLPAGATKPVDYLYGAGTTDALLQTVQDVVPPNVEPSPGQIIVANQTVRYSYDVYGNKISVQVTSPSVREENICSYKQKSDGSGQVWTCGPEIRSYNAVSSPFYATYDDDGFIKTETGSTYELDSRGNRLLATGGQANGFKKRYNSDNLPVQYDNKAGYTLCVDIIACTTYPAQRFNEFRYDPFGQQILSSTGQMRKTSSNYDTYSVFRDWVSSHFVQGQLQIMIRNAGDSNWECNESGVQCKATGIYSYSGIQYRDSTYSMLDGASDTVSWNGVQPLAVVRNTVQALDAPVQSLSSLLRINPLDVVTQGLPNLPDPGLITGSGVEPKDVSAPVRTGADQSVKQAVTIVAIGPVMPQMKAAARAQVPAGGSVLTMEVQPGFDDGEGFSQPIYAVHPFSEFQSVGGYIKKYGPVKGLEAYSKDRETEFKRQAEQKVDDAQEADKIEKKLRDQVNSMLFSNPKGVDLTKAVHNSIRNILDWSHGNMSPVERLALYVGLSIALDMGTGFQHRDARDRGTYLKFEMRDNFSLTLATMDNPLLKLKDSGEYTQQLLKDSFLATAAAFYAEDQYRRVMGATAFALITAPGDAVALMQLGKMIGQLGKGLLIKRPNLFKASAQGVKSGLQKGTDLLDELVSCAANSFTPSTPVRTLSGLVAISALSLGTPVLAFNEETGKNGYYPITAVITHGTKDQGVTYLTINDPEQGNKPEFITTTPEHPFYIQQTADSSPRPPPEGHADLSAKWVGAGHLKIGDQIKQADGTVGVIVNVVTVKQTQEMFNLTVSEAHTFYVGQGGWLVHNQTGVGCLNLRFWNKPVSVGGRRVYQRDDLFDPNFVGPDGRTNLQRMRAGRAPIGNDGASVNLHHLTQDEPGSLAEVGGLMHNQNGTVLHGFPPAGVSFRQTPALDRQFTNYTARYWRAQSRAFREGTR